MLESERSGVAVCLQVRVGSTRLPGKALMKIGELTITEWAMLALKEIGAPLNILLTDEASEEVLKPLADKQGFEIFVGPAQDVLLRYCLCIKKYGIKTVVRATGDNPFVGGLLANLLLEEFFQGDFDYAGYLGIPSGTGVEAVKAEALLKAESLTSDSYDREHVCPYLYNNKTQFGIFQKTAPKAYCLPSSRITVDTKADLDFARTIYAETGLPARTDVLVQVLKKHQEDLGHE